MDKDTIDLITKINSEQSRNMEKIINLKEKNDILRTKGIQKSMEAGMETVAIEIRKLNGNINENSENIKELKKQTSWWRFFQRNPGKTAVVSCILVIGVIVIMGFDVNVKKIMEIISNFKP